MRIENTPDLSRIFASAIPAQPEQPSSEYFDHDAMRMRLSRFWLTDGCTQMMVAVSTGSFTHGAMLMELILQSWQLYFLILAGWINRQQQEVIEYLRTENQVLKESLGKKRILLNDDQGWWYRRTRG